MSVEAAWWAVFLGACFALLLIAFHCWRVDKARTKARDSVSDAYKAALKDAALGRLRVGSYPEDTIEERRQSAAKALYVYGTLPDHYQPPWT